MKLVVGLGNPGLKYKKTRHNMGFLALDHYLEKYNPTFKEKNGGLYYEANINGDKVIFLKPQKFMNLSGEVIKSYMDFYKIEVNDLLVIFDDTSFDLGQIKLKPKGSSGGHNGIKNIIDNIKSEEFKRIKLGISSHKGILRNYVLGKIDDTKILDEVLNKTDMIIEDYFKMDFEKLMSKYN